MLYFTHDYLSMTHDKNAFLKATARISKQQGVSNLIAVCPIEHDMYCAQSDEGKDPIAERTQAEDAAMSEFSQMAILRPDLVFGNYGYAVRYMT